MTALEIAKAGCLAFGQPTGNYYEAKDAAAVFALGLKIDGGRTETLKLRGLDTDARYSVCEINCGGRLHLVGGARFIASVAGRDLMERGLDITLFGGYDSAVFEICKKEQSR